MSAELIVFLGPSLTHAEAERELKKIAAPKKGKPLSFLLEPPAQQGDVWRALAQRPRAIALIDGLFESAPSVWHHELLDAIDAGVLVFGAASMGALRASELHSRGMLGVGKIFARYRGGLDDDAAVALLHADAESDFAPLTIPLVNAEHAIEAALERKVLNAEEARQARASASRLHYQDRRWPEIFDGAKLSDAARERWNAFADLGLPDLKADDARLCVRESAQAALAQRNSALSPRANRSPPSSARVRAHRAALLSAHAGTPSPEEERAAQQTQFIAAVARAQGLVASSEHLADLTHRIFGDASAAQREQRLLDAGVANDELRSMLETLALEELALAAADRILPDGPSQIEATRLAQVIAALTRTRR
jgi:hypothetical protein